MKSWWRATTSWPTRPIGWRSVSCTSIGSLGIGHLLLEAQESRMDHATTMRSIELMGKSVIPAMAGL